MTQHPLPFEVLYHIIDDVDNKGDLRSISLASRALRDEGQRALFRHTGTLKIELPELSGNRFLDSIIASPHRLAHAVHSFEAHLVWERRPVGRKCGFDRGYMPDPTNLENIVKFIDKLERALMLMTNLKSLSIMAMRNKVLLESVPPLPRILRRCTFQLHEFCWEHVRSDDELIISEFLPHQSALRSFGLLSKQCINLRNRVQYSRAFHLYTATGRLNLNLETLCGPPEMTLGLLNCMDGKPSRIRYLRWTIGAERIGSPAESPNLKILGKIRLFHVDYNILNDQESEYCRILSFPFLDDLRVLRFRTSSFRKITQEHINTLCRLPKLQVLVIVDPMGIMKAHDDQAQTVVENLFSCCSNLEYIDVETSATGLLQMGNTAGITDTTFVEIDGDDTG
ncbi:hypothetical protein D9619_007922 [Psilocybe cf. subviscida]|uniref:F-box domain-containing protein n=1 Tax=Psilocybe cf. subviscida TaxID=2480587 RepID=A0A8H5AUG9_9AGAR|nr:hypothetical protein D9619_007922 [Psilocybe cf. subviscida]